MSILQEKRAVNLRCSVASCDGARTSELLCPQALWEGDSLRFDADTAAVCAALSFSAERPELLEGNLTALGFDGLSVYAPGNTDPTRITMTVAQKRLPDGTLAAAVLRGTQGAEWYANFRVGFRTEHRGFALAADYAEQRLDDYIRAHVGGREVRFLVTGYSRGGAAANLLARRLCDRYGADSVRCYTFASPNTALAMSGAQYDSIYHLVREEDFFTRVPLTDWGYTRCGRSLSLGGDIGRAYRAITGEEYLGFADKGAVDAALEAVRALAPSVHAYYHRRYPVGERMLSLYDYMLSVAEILAGDADGDAGELLLDSAASEFAGLTAFLSFGMDLGALLTPGAGLPWCSVADSHSPAAYLAAMKEARLLP